mgnify:CR=1 FL=1
MSSRQRRIAHKQKAAEVLEDHTGPVLGVLADVVHELSAENEGLSQFEADMQYAAELSYRLDNMIKLSDPIAEALDGVVTFFVALAAIGIWRQLARKEGLRGQRLDRLKERLLSKGPKMAPAARKRLQRRIKRIQERA